MSTRQQALPDKIRKVFETWGVIKRVAVPKLDLLDKEITDRKGTWSMSTSEGMSTATVVMGGTAFDGIADEANLALSLAFAQALKATNGAQATLFDLGGADDDEDDE